jgi:polysaccharide transporter, PST family
VSSRRQIGLLAMTQPATQLVGIVVSFVLARHLFPRDYGLVAMATSFTGVLGMLSGLGLSDAAIQRKELSESEASALFWVNAGAGLAFGLAAAGIGPVLGRYFAEPTVPIVAAWAAAAMFLSALVGQHRIHIMRLGRYGAVAAVELLTQVVAGIAGIAAAVAGLGWKALVVLFVTQAVSRAVGLVTLARWLPGPFRRDSLPRDTMRLGLVVCLGWVLTSLSATAEGAVLGKVGGADGLGLYTKAMQLARYPVMVFFIPVFLPAVHRLGQRQDDREAMGREFLRMLLLVMLPMSLALGVLAGCARDFVPLVMGRQWEPAVPLLLVILVGILGVPVAQAAMWGLTASAQRKRMVQFQVVNATVPVASVTCGALLAGAWGTCVAFAIGTWGILVPIGVVLAVRFVGVNLAQLSADVGTVGLLVAATALTTWLGGRMATLAFGPSLVFRVSAEILSGAVLWFLIARRLRPGTLREALETLASGAGLDQNPWASRFVNWCTPASN